jgi:hypothetical protein
MSPNPLNPLEQIASVVNGVVPSADVTQLVVTALASTTTDAAVPGHLMVQALPDEPLPFGATTVDTARTTADIRDAASRVSTMNAEVSATTDPTHDAGPAASVEIIAVSTSHHDEHEATPPHHDDDVATEALVETPPPEAVTIDTPAPDAHAE